MDIVSYVIGRASAGGGSSSGGSAKECKIYSGYFYAEAKKQTVMHEIGEVPDIFILHSNDVPETGSILFARGYSQKMFNILDEKYVGGVTFLMPGTTITLQASEGIEFPNEEFARFGILRNATPQGIDVGGTEYGLTPGKPYHWEAITGLV